MEAEAEGGGAEPEVASGEIASGEIVWRNREWRSREEAHAKSRKGEKSSSGFKFMGCGYSEGAGLKFRGGKPINLKPKTLFFKIRPCSEVDRPRDSLLERRLEER
jgi:hypothetical protein